MKRPTSLTACGWIAFLICTTGCFAPLAGAVEATDLRDQAVDGLYGRYAPRGDCTREPRIVVSEVGFAFEVAGKTTKTTKIEHAVSYGGDAYNGTSEWFFPFIVNGSYPILMTFNAAEKRGTLTIEGHDEGWKGGPPLRPLNRALVAGSPYAKCKR